ncbi:tRNA lysidine(34) synthetase TilS [Dinghuibacter silviterrae]|uniref:tRNA(Ile)-lysidine synthase n=1 Tax=Dinghuibacter silviterrae TaxID=1539049 RepID=A0A4R8DHP7_9BACT|nr:tRNA lysidine(34) synthetase TilS [Dinghuibacter silviterrae]TDW96774.1 tRNA(Ile)-lysidine synthase [Dinghuibacter silviterrae]
MEAPLLTRFTAFLHKEHLLRPGDSWLLAVSGGLDSVVLAHLCVLAGIEGPLVHCNFQLRGAESDRDEAFVRALAERYGRAFQVARFDTAAYAASHKVSIQVAARELRYTWFRQLLGAAPAASGAGIAAAPTTAAPSTAAPSTAAPPAAAAPAPRLTAIATAHHLDDNIETMLMNLFKGTGASGLRGMLPFQEQIVRPLLFATREELETYAAAEGLQHVEDSSNASDKYTRNFFRHKVIPLIEERYPDVRQNLAANLTRFRDLEDLYRQAVTRHVEDLLEPHGRGEWRIAVAKLEKARPLETLLFELLKPFGFSPAQAGEALALLHTTSGHFVASATHRVIRDRRFLIICAPAGQGVSQVAIEEGQTQVAFTEGVITIAMEAAPAAAAAPPAAAASLAAAGPPAAGPPAGRAHAPRASEPLALLDAARVTFPLLLRRWKAGDYFYPLGMAKKKKLARFFIDNKLSLADKEKVWVLESGGRILWVVGHRIDDRFKVTAGTTHALRLEWTQP